MVSDLDFGVSVFVGLVSIAPSYYCIRDKWQHHREVDPELDYIKFYLISIEYEESDIICDDEI